MPSLAPTGAPLTPAYGMDADPASHYVNLPFTAAAVSAALGPWLERFVIEWVERCDSTNTQLLASAATARDGTVLIAREQTEGRGRLGRDWVATADASLTFSLFRRLPRHIMRGGLSLAVGVALAESLNSLGYDGIRLKWPNDVLRHGGKLAGVLVELAGQSDNEVGAVIGIGLNLRLPAAWPDDLRAASAALDLPPDAAARLLAQLLIDLAAVLDEFVKFGFVALRARWLAHCAHLGQAVRILDGDVERMTGRCAGVADDGALLLETTDGMQRVLSGDVSLRTVVGRAGSPG